MASVCLGIGGLLSLARMVLTLLQKFITLAPYIEKSPFLYKMVKPIANAYAHIAGYRQMGLKYDDLIVEENHQTQKVR